MPEEFLARHLGRFVSQLTYETFSAEQIDQLKTFFLDWLGSAWAGRDQPSVKKIRELVHEIGGNPEATNIPEGVRTNALCAALINGASSHVVEMDDLHREAIFHPAAAILPAVLAAAEQRCVSGQTLLTAIAAGYEIGLRVALAAGPGHYWFWHTTATCGTFGAAAGAAKIFGLDEEQTTWALGSAGTQAAGLWAFLVEGAMSKQLHTGKAALNGLLAARLAEKGFTGAEGILEGQKGFLKATAPDYDLEKALKDLGRQYAFTRNSIKFHASCGHTHSAIDAVLQATGGRLLKAQDVQKVLVYIYPQALDLLGQVEPKSPYAAKFNLPFCVASALRYGRVGLSEFDPARLTDPEIRGLSGLIQVISDEGLGRAYPGRWPARVEIINSDAGRLTGAVDFPKGDPENPLTINDLYHKFSELTGEILAGPDAEMVMDRAMNLEKIPDVSRFFEGIAW